jgi:CRP/FNR family nitrogen fixation transcriptional regulator
MRQHSAIHDNEARPGSDEPVALHCISRPRRFGRDQEIYSQGDRSTGWFRIASGATRQYLLQEDGRRRIVDIHLPGDWFGFSEDGSHHFGEQALVEGTVVSFYPSTRITELADRNPEVAGEIRRGSFETIERLQEQMLILGATTARRKVHAFLSHICHRLPLGDARGTTLPISRYDIADLLGLSAETVCRDFTDLQQCGAIRLEGPRHIRLITPLPDFESPPIEREAEPRTARDRREGRPGPLPPPSRA